jgi:hypothetical protein
MINTDSLNTNTAIMRQLMRTARSLEAEWSQVLRESVVTGTKVGNEVLVAVELLDFTMLRPVLAWRAFWNLWTLYLFNIQFFFSGSGKPRILNRWIRGHGCILLGDTQGRLCSNKMVISSVCCELGIEGYIAHARHRATVNRFICRIRVWTWPICNFWHVWQHKFNFLCITETKFRTSSSVFNLQHR